MHRQGPRERRVGGLAGSEWGGYILRAPGCSLEVKIRGLWVGAQQTRRTCSRIAGALAAGFWAVLTLCGCGCSSWRPTALRIVGSGSSGRFRD